MATHSVPLPEPSCPLSPQAPPHTREARLHLPARREAGRHAAHTRQSLQCPYLGPLPSHHPEPQAPAAKLCPAPLWAPPGSPGAKARPTSQLPAAHLHFQMPAWTAGCWHIHLHSLESSQWPREATPPASFLQVRKQALRSRAQVPQRTEVRRLSPQPRPSFLDQYCPSHVLRNSRLLDGSREGPKMLCRKRTCQLCLPHSSDPEFSARSRHLQEPDRYHVGWGWGWLVPSKGPLAVAGKGSS